MVPLSRTCATRLIAPRNTCRSELARDRFWRGLSRASSLLQRRRAGGLRLRLTRRSAPAPHRLRRTRPGPRSRWRWCRRAAPSSASSIFIASITSSSWPCSTLSPAAAFTSTMRPGIGAMMRLPPAASSRPTRTRAHGRSCSAGRWPSCTQHAGRRRCAAAGAGASPSKRALRTSPSQARAVRPRTAPRRAAAGNRLTARAPRFRSASPPMRQRDDALAGVTERARHRRAPTASADRPALPRARAMCFVLQQRGGRGGEQQLSAGATSPTAGTRPGADRGSRYRCGPRPRPGAAPAAPETRCSISARRSRNRASASRMRASALRAIDVPDDQLGDHRVVEDRDRVAFDHAASRCARAFDGRRQAQRARSLPEPGRKSWLRILGIQAHFDRVAVRWRICSCASGSGSPGGDAQLPLDQIQPESPFRSPDARPAGAC